MHALHKLLLFHLLTSLGQDALGGKIINGEKAPENSMLYMVSLQNSRGQHVCGGFLISEDFVLTAAHCDKHLTHVILGTHDLSRVPDGNKRFIESRHTYPSYKRIRLGKDIMLLKLSEKVQLNNNVQTIQLPTSETNIGDMKNAKVISGGPLVCNGKAVGIVSFNRAEVCDYPDFPNVYTDISNTLPGISFILNE
ncbi:Anionic trypsin-2 [Nibea albiflora]|uniref:Anionic trypsin-2 n=1 Tax=Nibea albiflora TaxID=240163 RepID=A0ACB7ENT6_NIBAL|nr:Anionic trypsin-2 [Nibea albiflora]